MKFSTITLIGPQTNDTPVSKVQSSDLQNKVGETNKPQLNKDSSSPQKPLAKTKSTPNKKEVVLQEVPKNQRMNLLKQWMGRNSYTPEELEAVASKNGFAWKANSIKQYLKPPTFDKIDSDGVNKFKVV